MIQSDKILKEAIEKVGVKQLAGNLNVSQALIYKWCQESGDPTEGTASGAVNPLDRIQKIYESTEDVRLINWVCQLADGTFVPNPSKGKLPNDTKVLVNIQSIIKEFSEALAAISDSYMNGKRITLKESEDIRREWEDLKQVGESFVKACEMGYFDKQEQEGK